MEIRVDAPNLAALQALATQLPQWVDVEVGRAMQEAVLIAEPEIAQRTPVDTGRLRGSVASDVQKRGDWEGRVFTQQVPYAVPVEEGTQPHEIHARNGKALRFRAGGRVLFRRKVQHPGTKGAHMFRDGAAASEARIGECFARALVRVAQKAGMR